MTGGRQVRIVETLRVAFGGISSKRADPKEAVLLRSIELDETSKGFCSPRQS
jgi:hypothetical protein